MGHYISDNNRVWFGAQSDLVVKTEFLPYYITREQFSSEGYSSHYAWFYQVINTWKMDLEGDLFTIALWFHL